MKSSTWMGGMGGSMRGKGVRIARLMRRVGNEFLARCGHAFNLRFNFFRIVARRLQEFECGLMAACPDHFASDYDHRSGAAKEEIALASDCFDEFALRTRD